MQGNCSEQAARDWPPIDATALGAALERGEITAHFEPQIEVRTAEVRGVAALPRWRHPRLGWVPPEQFVPLAEESGLMRLLTLQVMRQALLQASVWDAMGRRLTVAVQVSRGLLQRPELLEDFTCLQQSCGLPAESLMLEVSAKGPPGELESSLAMLTRLRLRGFGLSLADYGSGGCSLRDLADIPFTEVKIDRSCVHRLHEREQQPAWLNSVLAVAAELGLASLADGVERLGEWRQLRQLGCGRAQGRLFTQALPALEFSLWLRAYRPRPLLARSLISAVACASAAGAGKGAALAAAL